MPHALHFGRNDSPEDSRDLKFANYLVKKELPKRPKYYGHYDKIPTNAWGMLGNDEYGDCVWAGSAHEVMMLNAARGRTVDFTTAGVLSDYASTGFDPRTGAGDNGTDMRQAAKYRQKNGIIDADGNRHKIGAYAWLEPGNYDQMLTALYLFETVGIGFQVPANIFDMFDAGKTWTPTPNAEIIGGHYVPLVGRHSNTKLVSWGSCVAMSKAFYEAYVDEALVYISPTLLEGGVSLEGFDVNALTEDLHTL